MCICLKCDKVVDSEYSMDIQLQSFRDQVEKIRSALPDDAKDMIDTRSLLQGVEWVFEKKKFVQTAQVIFDQAKQAIGADTGYIAIYNEEECEVEILISDTGKHVSTAKGAEGESVPLRGVRKEVLEKCRTVSCNNFKKSKYARNLPAGHIPVNNILFSPLVINKKGQGILAMANKDGGFTASDKRISKLFAELAAMSLEKSHAWTYLGKTGLEISETDFVF